MNVNAASRAVDRVETPAATINLGCSSAANGVTNSTPGTHEFAVEARFQSCNDVLCLPPRTVRVTTPLTVRAK